MKISVSEEQPPKIKSKWKRHWLKWSWQLIFSAASPSSNRYRAAWEGLKVLKYDVY